jgi:hypothetical protein
MVLGAGFVNPAMAGFIPRQARDAERSRSTKPAPRLPKADDLQLVSFKSSTSAKAPVDAERDPRVPLPTAAEV